MRKEQVEGIDIDDRFLRAILLAFDFGPRVAANLKHINTNINTSYTYQTIPMLELDLMLSISDE